MEQSLHGTSLEPAEEAIEEGNIKLQEALTDKKKLCREKIQKTEAMIQMGTEGKNARLKLLKISRKRKEILIVE